MQSKFVYFSLSLLYSLSLPFLVLFCSIQICFWRWNLQRNVQIQSTFCPRQNERVNKTSTSGLKCLRFWLKFQFFFAFVRIFRIGIVLLFIVSSRFSMFIVERFDFLTLFSIFIPDCIWYCIVYRWNFRSFCNQMKLENANSELESLFYCKIALDEWNEISFDLTN